MNLNHIGRRYIKYFKKAVTEFDIIIEKYYKWYKENMYSVSQIKDKKLIIKLMFDWEVPNIEEYKLLDEDEENIKKIQDPW